VAEVNFVAHAHLCLGLPGSGTDEAFGAILPDLASMAGVRLDRERLAAGVRRGVEIHHATDGAFHASLGFRSGSADLREALFDRGVETGPRRAVSHAGYELLLDGCLLEEPGVEREFTALLQTAPDVTSAVATGEPARLRQLLVSLEADRWWQGYRDPEVVALRLYRRLLGRRRLTFGASDVPAVAGALRAVRPSVAASMEALVADTLEGVRTARTIA
jgi:hypothetical protein